MIIEIMWIFEDWFDNMTDLDNKKSLDLHSKVYIFCRIQSFNIIYVTSLITYKSAKKYFILHQFVL